MKYTYFMKKNKIQNYFKFNKKFEIFQTFLSIGIDISGLYTLNDEMNWFLLNPNLILLIITYMMI